MTVERQTRSLSLEQTLKHAEECTRALIKQLQNTVALRLGDFNDLSRPVRRRSHYPTHLVMDHALKRVEQANAEARTLTEYLLKQLLEIRAQVLAVRGQKSEVRDQKSEVRGQKSEVRGQGSGKEQEASRRTAPKSNDEPRTENRE